MTIVAVGKEFELHETVCWRWIAGLNKSTAMPSTRRPSAAAPTSPSPADLATGNARLERELHRAETERDILEKAAAAIVLDPSPTGLEPVAPRRAAAHDALFGGAGR